MLIREVRVEGAGRGPATSLVARSSICVPPATMATRQFLSDGLPMAALDLAPGWPGIPPTWTSSAKHVVPTPLGASRAWTTLGDRIVNEIYWPSASLPQARALGFSVSGPSASHELKRVDRCTITL